MNSIMVRDFQNRIANAGQSDLLLINYEMLMITIDEAAEVIRDGNKDSSSKKLHQAQKLLRELIDSLDFRFDISKDLMAIYIYINKQLIEASVTFKAEPLVQASNLLVILFKGWQEAGKEGGSKKPIMQNTQKIYAGLTYGKGTLNETMYNIHNSRGYKA